MLEEKTQYGTDDNEQEYDLDEKQNNYCFENEIVVGRVLEAVMNFLGSITLFLGIVLTLIIFAISKIIQLLTISTVRMTRLEEQLMELSEDGVVNLVIDPNIKMTNRETRRNRK